ncbi:ead/Ea22-like family protein [Salmonella enterica]|uniref:ead/Ea22-like family protein n=1 Tax=Salmonella enterica TaxID=28901 RepID=UPI00216D87F1|nr:ead/Ea22-like family protein [Salmonella enterica subsp. enterica serovar Newport]MCR5998515.1 ead/Ea22-like family protein [Salmonella enterica subsp. enterica serovar Newport]MCR6016322.1 ead/Ea22-like family protein [Salmonella enterica subsp. enterica serovar Newport]
MSKIDYQALREAAARAIPAMERLLMLPVDDDLISEQELKDSGVDIDALNAFKFLAGPETVLALLDESNALEETRINDVCRIAELTKQLELAKSKLNEQREYYEGVISDGSKRIAELESNEVREVRNQFLVVRHPGKTPAIKHCTGDLEEFLRKLIEQDPLVTIDIITHRYYGVGGQWVQDAGEYLQMMQGAGIGVKHQEDSVDSDVSSRNQPGMVVAVHIDAGDFVKVKGQVFEVEETDFDDHDVTLWFVGGNTLKCAAGCPVEVVSAPVAAGIKVKGSEHDRSTKR